MVPPASRRIPRVLRYSGSRLYFVLSSTGLLPSLEPLSFGLRLELFRLYDPATPVDRGQLVWPLTTSLAATTVIEFSFSSSGYLDVSVHRVPSVTLWIHVTVMELHSTGFPHSDVCGSMSACDSPQLFAACHVLRRRLVPGHPPCALSSLIFANFLCRTESWLIIFSIKPARQNRLNHCLSLISTVRFSRCVSSLFSSLLPARKSGFNPIPQNDTV